MSDAAPGSVDRFDGRAADYASFRPSYPPGAIDAVLAGLGAPAEIVAIDVGCGTGISLQLLAERGVRAIGLEPNANMRAEATRLGLDVRPGSVLSHDLPRGEASLVTAFQAFHWFSDDASTAALAALLRPGGRIALVWNLFERSDPFTDAFGDLLDRFCDPHAIAGLGIDGAAIGASLDRGGFERRRVEEVPYVQALGDAALLGRLRSSSSAPTAGPVYDAMAAALHDVTSRRTAATGTRLHPLVHRTHLIIAELPASPNRG